MLIKTVHSNALLHGRTVQRHFVDEVSDTMPTHFNTCQMLSFMSLCISYYYNVEPDKSELTI